MALVLGLHDIKVLFQVDRLAGDEVPNLRKHPIATGRISRLDHDSHVGHAELKLTLGRRALPDPELSTQSIAVHRAIRLEHGI